MDNISSVIGKNIENLIIESKVTKSELADLICVTRSTFDRFLTGESTIDSYKLSILSKFFNKPFEYFFEKEHLDEFYFMFRANNPKDNYNAKDKQTILNKIDCICQAEELSNIKYTFIPPQYNLKIKLENKKLSQEDEKSIEEISIEQREYLNIDDCIDVDIVKCFQDKGIRVIFEKFNNDKLFGFSAYNEKKGCFIIINDDLEISEERKIFSVVHEYAHLIFHRDIYMKDSDSSCYTNYKNDENEKVANTFAGYFLVPYKIIEKIYNKNKEPNLIQLKKQLKVSLDALVMQLNKYKKISEFEKTDYFKKKNYEGYSKKEKSPLKYFEKNKYYEGIIKDLYFKDEISENKLAELLNLNILDTRNKIKEWLDDEENIPVFI